MELDLTIETKSEISIEPLSNGRIELTARDVDIDDVIASVGLGNLLENMDIDEVISELAEKGYTITEG